MPEQDQRRTKRGYLNPRAVRRIVFWTTSACIFVGVVACMLAIWEFTGSDVLWRTVATCAIVAAGMMAFFVVNALLDWPRE